MCLSGASTVDLRASIAQGEALGEVGKLRLRKTKLIDRWRQRRTVCRHLQTPLATLALQKRSRMLGLASRLFWRRDRWQPHNKIVPSACPVRL